MQFTTLDRNCSLENNFIFTSVVTMEQSRNRKRKFFGKYKRQHEFSDLHTNMELILRNVHVVGSIPIGDRSDN